MKNKLLGLVLAGLAVGLVPARVGSSLGDAGNIIAGAYVSAVPVDERLTFRDVKAGITRQSILIPASYGTLFSIMERKEAAVLWFQSDDGTIRNVPVDPSQLL